MGKIENIEIFEDTQKQYRTEPQLVEAVRKSDRLQKVIPEQFELEEVPARYTEPARIFVSAKRSFEAAQGYKDQPVCVLNFASATNPGGGVTRGSSAQEECLCRVSTLYANLSNRSAWSGFYRPHRDMHNTLYNNDCIYTPGVIVFKSDTAFPELLPAEQRYQVNVITCAAPNLRPPRDGRPDVQIRKEALYQLHISRARRILEVAAANGNEVVILGAYGCGAFQNPPEVVAKAMKQVANEYRYHFRTIEFAVYCSPRDDWNYQVFQKLIGQ